MDIGGGEYVEEYRARPGQSHVVDVKVGGRYGNSNFVQPRAEGRIDEKLVVQIKMP